MNFTTILKFIYSEKATKFCEIFTLFLSYVVVVPVKSKEKISQNFVAFSKYMNFMSKNISTSSSDWNFFRWVIATLIDGKSYVSLFVGYIDVGMYVKLICS